MFQDPPSFGSFFFFYLRVAAHGFEQVLGQRADVLVGRDLFQVVEQRDRVLGQGRLRRLVTVRQSRQQAQHELERRLGHELLAGEIEWNT